MLFKVSFYLRKASAITILIVSSQTLSARFSDQGFVTEAVVKKANGRGAGMTRLGSDAVILNIVILRKTFSSW